MIPSKKAVKNEYRGFTLIELLVTLAIIGILAQIIYSSVVSAYTSSKEAKIKQTLTSIRSKAELLYYEWGNYNYGRSYMKTAATCPAFISQGGNKSLFSTTTGAGNELLSIISLLNTPDTDIKCLAGNSVSEWNYSNGGTYGATSWAISVKSLRNPNNSFCIDFTSSVVKEISSSTPSDAIYQAQSNGQPFSPALSSNEQNDARCI